MHENDESKLPTGSIPFMNKLNKKRFFLWLVPLLLYLLFVFWYTDFKGPITDKEINLFVSTLEKRGVDDEILNTWIPFFKNDTGNEFFMVNAIDMRDDPPQAKGNGPTADEQMAEYMKFMFSQLLKRASHPVMLGDAVHTALDIYGIENAEKWDMAALFRYRNRRVMLELMLDPRAVDSHEFKFAALEKTISYPVETKLYLGDLRLLLGLIMFSFVSVMDRFIYRKREISKATIPF